MNKFDHAPRNDTVLNTGLLAIAIAWVALAAIRGPVTPIPEFTGAPAQSAGRHAADVAGARKADLPASAKTIGRSQVS